MFPLPTLSDDDAHALLEETRDDLTDAEYTALFELLTGGDPDPDALPDHDVFLNSLADSLPGAQVVTADEVPRSARGDGRATADDVVRALNHDPEAIENAREKAHTDARTAESLRATDDIDGLLDSFEIPGPAPTDETDEDETEAEADE